MVKNNGKSKASLLVDPFDRPITYLRVSVTDRCDFRCFYCMSEKMTFLPRKDLLTLEELDRICSCFVSMGVRKIRITGGEPLVRRDVMSLFKSLSRFIDNGMLDEVTVTTNGSQLAKYAQQLYDNGVRRINVSIDTLDKDKFHQITRRGDLAVVLDAIEVAQKVGLKIKLNTVALHGVNDDEIISLAEYAHGRDMDITFIETMPLGEIDGDRTDHYLPLTVVRKVLSDRFTLIDDPHRTGGPARYVRAAETGKLIGFITPLSHNFCESCNRVRLTCTGRLYMCLGQDDQADMLAPLRSSSSNEPVIRAIREAISRKPQGHDFVIDRVQSKPKLERYMSVTGG